MEPFRPCFAAELVLCASSVRDVVEVVSPSVAMVHDAGNERKVPYFMDFRRFPAATLADVILTGTDQKELSLSHV